MGLRRAGCTDRQPGPVVPAEYQGDGRPLLAFDLVAHFVEVPPEDAGAVDHAQNVLQHDLLAKRCGMARHKFCDPELVEALMFSSGVIRLVSDCLSSFPSKQLIRCCHNRRQAQEEDGSFYCYLLHTFIYCYLLHTFNSTWL